MRRMGSVPRGVFAQPDNCGIKCPCERRIFNSWLEARSWGVNAHSSQALLIRGHGLPALSTSSLHTMEMKAPTLTTVSFHDAYCYMDWLLTVYLLV